MLFGTRNRHFVRFLRYNFCYRFAKIHEYILQFFISTTVVLIEFWNCAVRWVLPRPRPPALWLHGLGHDTHSVPRGGGQFALNPPRPWPPATLECGVTLKRTLDFNPLLCPLCLMQRCQVAGPSSWHWQQSRPCCSSQFCHWCSHLGLPFRLGNPREGGRVPWDLVGKIWLPQKRLMGQWQTRPSPLSWLQGLPLFGSFSYHHAQGNLCAQWSRPIATSSHWPWAREYRN